MCVILRVRDENRTKTRTHRPNCTPPCAYQKHTPPSDFCHAGCYTYMRVPCGSSALCVRVYLLLYILLLYVYNIACVIYKF